MQSIASTEPQRSLIKRLPWNTNTQLAVLLVLILSIFTGYFYREFLIFSIVIVIPFVFRVMKDRAPKRQCGNVHCRRWKAEEKMGITFCHECEKRERAFEENRRSLLRVPPGITPGRNFQDFLRRKPQLDVAPAATEPFQVSHD